MDKQEIYRMIAGEQFDLLTDDEKRRLADSLTGRADVDPVDVARRLRAALLGSTETERDQAFRDALNAANAPVVPGMRPYVPRPRGAGFVRGVWRLTLAAAAGAAVVWLAIGGPRVADTPEGSLGGGDAIFLGVERATTEPQIDLDATSSPHITLVVEARIPSASVHWRVTDYHGADIATGSVDFAAPSEALRTLAVRVPKSRLPVAQVCRLVLEDADGAPLGRFAFRIE